MKKQITSSIAFLLAIVLTVMSSSIFPVYAAEEPAISSGNTISELEGNVSEMAEPPAPVLDLTIRSRSVDSLELAWSASEDADGYLIEQKNGDTWKLIGDITEQSYQVTGLSPSTEYRFQIKSYCWIDGEQVIGDPAEISGITLPENPSGVTISNISENSLRINWGKDSKASGYLVEQKIDGQWVEITEIKGNTTLNYTVKGLTPYTTYQFRIKSIQYDGSTRLTSPNGVAVSAKTNLGKVSDLKISSRSTADLTLSWKKNSSATGYIVEQYTGGNWVQIAKISKNNTISYKVTGLKEYKTYKFRVKSYHYDGKKNQYSSYQTLSAKTNPGKATRLKISGRSASAIKLSWKKADKATGYLVQQYENGKWVQLAEIKNNTTVSYKVTGLKANQSYQFRVRNVIYDGSKRLSGSAVKISGKTSPSQVAGFQISSRSTTALKLSWKKNTTAKEYVLQQYKGGKWVKIANIRKNSTVAYKVTGLRPYGNYQFRIKGINTDGSTQLSSSYVTVSGKTKPNQISGLKISSRTTNALTIQWEKDTKAKGYVVEQYKSGKWVKLAEIKKNSTVSYQVTGLKQYTNYKFRVKSYILEGEKHINSNVVELTGKVKPAKVKTVKVGSATDSTLKISWTKEEKAAGYVIYQYKNGKWAQIALIKGSSTVSYKANGLSPSTTYKFLVKTYVNDNGTRICSGGVEASGKTTVKKLNTLKTKMQSVLSGYNGSWSVYVKDMKTGESIVINNKQYYAASVIKAFVMASTYNQIEKGVMKNTSTVQSLLKDMITQSDNEAYNELVKLQGGSRDFYKGASIVNSYLKKNGYTGTILGHTLHPAYSSSMSTGVSNMVTAQDCGVLLERIYKGECVSKDASKKMLNLLLKQQRRWKIPAGLPSGTKIGNKTGETDTSDHDIAIVYSPKSTYVLCILSENSSSSSVRIQLLSTMVYQFLNS